MTLKTMPEEEQDREMVEKHLGAYKACRLTDLGKGEAATITEIADAYEHSELLEGYGIAPGARVARERNAPQGDPIIFRVEGRLVALRREDAEHVLVRRERAE